MRLTHLIGIVGAAALLSVTGFAAQHAGQRDQVLTAYEVMPAPPAPVPAVEEFAASGPASAVGEVAASGPASAVEEVAASRPASAVEEVAQRPSRNPAFQSAVDPRWVRRTADAAGIPGPALAAYARASVLAPGRCRIGWTTLAGIGWVESQHGTIGDRLLGEDGRSSTPILGPALDGGLYAAVPATRDSVRWHGDRQWDHAIGPMQFIPSTWRTWQVDGDGDGLADPNDIDDASLAAANYLCESGDLTTAGTWSRSILSYNHSTDYVLNVYTAADAYADRTG